MLIRKGKVMKRSPFLAVLCCLSFGSFCSAEKWDQFTPFNESSHYHKFCSIEVVKKATPSFHMLAIYPNIYHIRYSSGF